MAFILILHLDPTHVSMLPELLRKYTQMPIRQAEDGTKVEANTIHIIPPNKKMAAALGGGAAILFAVSGYFESLILAWGETCAVWLHLP